MNCFSSVRSGIFVVPDTIKIQSPIGVAYLNMSLLTELGISLGAFLQIGRAYGAEEKNAWRQEWFRAGLKLAPGIGFQRETRQAANQAAQ
jgi:hypothetical protein